MCEPRHLQHSALEISPKMRNFGVGWLWVVNTVCEVRTERSLTVKRFCVEPNLGIGVRMSGAGFRSALTFGAALHN